MNTAYDIQAKKDAKKYKKLFDICDNMGVGIHDKLHICDSSEDGRFPDEDKEYRVYHADGYCFDVRKQRNEPEEGCICVTCIGNYEYSFLEGVYDGFKDIDIDGAIKLFSK